MSQENVEILRESFEAFDRRDRAAWLASRDQDVEIVTDDDWPEANAVRGRESAWEFYVKVADAFDGLLAQDARLTDGGDTVVVHQRSDVRGRASGAQVELDYWVVVTFQKRRIVREVWFADRAKALDAAGLSG